MELKIEYLPITELKPYENNARKHAEADIEAIKKSIEEFGFNDPIGIWHDTIVEGHGRLLAAQELEMAEVPVIRLDHMTDEERRAYALAHNKTAELSEWDFEMLDTELDDIFDIDMSQFGFDISADDEPIEIVEDEVPENAPSMVKLGDVWQLGEHRLICGDSTDVAVIDRLMDGAKADMVFTDPPYALFGNSTGVAGVVDDKMTRPFFLAIFQRIREHTKLFGHIYVCCDWHSAFSLQAMAKQAKLTEKNLCIWDKGDGGLGAMYQQCYEMIWFFANSPLATKVLGKRESGERTINGKPNIWRYARENKKERVHNAQKPLEMVKFAVGNSCDMEEIVLDLFGGSGTTLIACEQLNRKCHMCEIDEHYCDVIIQRWENYTGEKAKLLTPEELR